jgi:Uma2 family endonuclease
MSTQPKTRYTPQEYLAFERKSEYRSEYFDGEVFAMGGASRWHNLVAMNIAAELRAQLRSRPCEVYPSDMRVKVAPTGLYTYPDVTVVCGEPSFEDEQHDTLLNPTVLIEVLAKSTENYDRGKKFEHYRQVNSLIEYVLVAQQEPHVEHYARQEDEGWLLTEVKGLDATLILPAIDCELQLAEVYHKVDFARSAEGSG